MVALSTYRTTGAPVEIPLNSEIRLSPRYATLCIFALSLVSWAIVLVPLWAVMQLARS